MYTIRIYGRVDCGTAVVEKVLSTSREFAIATNSAFKFATVGHAVAIAQYENQNCWIEGPRGGRYDATTGRRLV